MQRLQGKELVSEVTLSYQAHGQRLLTVFDRQIGSGFERDCCNALDSKQIKVFAPPSLAARCVRRRVCSLLSARFPLHDCKPEWLRMSKVGDLRF